ncbi:MAG: hypothetical protein LUI60_02725 [Clostridia bacterium]|nr:hypothetical protein [Clostridia bacterium]
MNKVKRYFFLICRNFRAHKWLNLQIILCFAVLGFLITLFSIFSFSLNTTQSAMAANYISANYITSDTAINFEDDGIEKLTYKTYDANAATSSVLGMELDYIIYSIIQIKIDNHNYLCIENGNLSINTGETLFTKNDLKEASGTLLYGTYPTSASEICISQNLLECFGIAADEITGKTISISFIKNSAAILDDVTICGIISSEYYNLSGHNGGSYQIIPDIWTAQDCQLFSENSKWNIKYVYSFEEWLSESQADYYETLYGCKYIGNYVTEDIAIISNMQTLTLNIALMIGIFIAIGLLLIMYLLTDKYLRLFFISGGILKVCGMDSADLKLLLYLQIIFICLLSAVISALLSVTIYAVISSLIYSILYIKLIAPSWGVFALTYIIATAIIVIVAFIICILKTRNINSTTIRSMLETRPY